MTVPVQKVFGDRISMPHLMAFLHYNSPRKAANLLHVMTEAFSGRSKLRSRPFIMFLEVNNICNLHCPFCLTGKGKTADRPRRNMTLSEMKQAIRDLSPYLYFIQLYNWGEPLLNPDLFDFIRYAHEQRIFTMASSNMNFVRPEIAEQLVESNLDYFIAAIDGFSENSYLKYRHGGNFKKAIHNLEAVTRTRTERGRVHPFIEWQYVVFKHNEHEINAARKFSEQIGIDYFHPIPGYIEDPQWTTTLPEYQADLGRPESVAGCKRPWTHFNVRADGGVAACCYEYYRKDDFGNIFQTPFGEVWNNEMFSIARKVLAKGLRSAPRHPRTICHKCVANGIRPSFENSLEG